MSYNILVPIATGSEEIEAITIIDVMVRAGYHVVIASADPTEQLVVKASRGVMLTADIPLRQSYTNRLMRLSCPEVSPVPKTFAIIRTSLSNSDSKNKPGDWLLPSVRHQRLYYIIIACSRMLSSPVIRTFSNRFRQLREVNNAWCMTAQPIC